MMKINKAEEAQVIKYIKLEVIFKNYPPFDLVITTIDGKVDGNYKDVATSYLRYFNENSDRVRKQHFKFFKDYIEKTFT